MKCDGDAVNQCNKRAILIERPVSGNPIHHNSGKRKLAWAVCKEHVTTFKSDYWKIVRILDSVDIMGELL